MKQELINIIYDTLFRNTNNKQFDSLLDDIDFQLVDSEHLFIEFQYKNKNYTLSIDEIK